MSAALPGTSGHRTGRRNVLGAGPLFGSGDDSPMLIFSLPEFYTARFGSNGAIPTPVDEYNSVLKDGRRAAD